MESNRQQMKPDVLMEMGLAMLEDDDEPLALGEPQLSVSLRSPYSRAEPVEVKLLKHVAEDINTFVNPFGDEFMLYRRQKSSVQLRQDYFSKLSDEVVLSVFKWLPKKTLIRCALVCRRWRRIAYDEGLWTRVDLGSKNFHDGTLADVVKRGVRILRLGQADIRDPVFKFNTSMEHFSSKLQYLDLSVAVISPEGLAILLNSTKHLIKLSLESCTLNEKVFKAIAKNTQLEVLNLTMCYNVTPRGLGTVTNSCRKLSALNVGWAHLDAEALDVLMCSVPLKLQQLNISGCREALSDKHIFQLVRRCPMLTELDISDSSITASSLEMISKLKNLEHLSLSRCVHISASCLANVASMPTLRFLDVFGMFQDIKALQNCMPGIELNKFIFSTIARPTVGSRRTSIWGLRSRD